jgi:COMPASS component SWD3
VAISPDGKTVAASYTGSKDVSAGIKLWDVATGAPYPKALYQGDAIPYGLVFTPDGRALVAAHHDGLTRRYWVESYQSEVLPEKHLGPVYGIALSRHGLVLVTAGRELCVWYRAEK